MLNTENLCIICASNDARDKEQSLHSSSLWGCGFSWFGMDWLELNVWFRLGPNGSGVVECTAWYAQFV